MSTDCASVRMVPVGSNFDWRRLEGQRVERFPLRQLLGSSDHSGVFLTTRGEAQSAAIKLLPADAEGADVYQSRWRRAAALSHPRLLRLFEMGRCRLDGREFVYLVMEHAAETLADILPQRPLTAAEAKDMLPPILEGLIFLHGHGLAHNRVQPSNIVVVEDQVKLSSDSIASIGKCEKSASPDAAQPVGSEDVWSLGVMLVQSLTQRAPAASSDASLESLPPLFHEIARGCLLPDPHRRWSVEEIARQLRIANGGKKPENKQKKPQKPSAPIALPPQARRYLFPALALVLALAVGVVGLRSFHHAATAPSASAEDANPSQPAIPSPPEAARGGVLNPVLPEVPTRALATIRGTVRVRVKVDVDSQGNVTGAELDRGGPSRYFARLALGAARQWKFQPTTAATRRQWLLSFGFTPSGTRAVAARATR